MVSARGLDVALPASSAQQGADLARRELDCFARCRGCRQHRKRVAIGQLSERVERCREVLAQRTAQPIGGSGSFPDQALMSPGEDLDSFRESGVAGDFAVIVTICSHELGEHLGVARIGLRTRQRVPIPIPRRRFRIDRVHDVASLDERAHPQPSVSFDPDHPRRRARRQGWRQGHGAWPFRRCPRAIVSMQASRLPRRTRRRRDGPRPNHRRQISR